MMRLGRIKSVPDARTLKMARYRTGIAVDTPVKVDYWSHIPKLGMMLNDSLGDCTIAAAGHMIEQTTFKANGAEVIIPDKSILKGYEEACGYVPGKPDTDQGGDMLTVLKYLRNTGLADKSGTTHKIFAFISVNPMNPQEVKEAIYLFGNLYCGVALPLTAQRQPKCWSVETYWKCSPIGQKDSWGGHCIPMVGYSDRAYPHISWGELMYMTPNFLQIYCDELYAVVTLDWINKKSNLSPSLFDLDQLNTDLSNL